MFIFHWHWPWPTYGEWYPIIGGYKGRKCTVCGHIQRRWNRG